MMCRRPAPQGASSSWEVSCVSPGVWHSRTQGNRISKLKQVTCCPAPEPLVPPGRSPGDRGVTSRGRGFLLTRRSQPTHTHEGRLPPLGVIIQVESCCVFLYLTACSVLEACFHTQQYPALGPPVGFSQVFCEPCPPLPGPVWMLRLQKRRVQVEGSGPAASWQEHSSLGDAALLGTHCALGRAGEEMPAGSLQR